MQASADAGGERRKSARHARQRFEEEQQEEGRSSSSSSSSECERASSSSSSSSECREDEAAVPPPHDPLHPLYPQPKYGFDDKKRKRGRIGRPMHKGDDEGREPAKRVRRPPPQPPEESLDQDGDGEEEEDDDIDGENDDDDAESLGASDSHSSSSSVTSDRVAASSQRKSQRIVTQSTAGAPATDDPIQEPAARPPRACASVSAQPNHKVRLSKCWLCTFSNCKMARRISEFVSASAGTMDPTIMADQIKAEVKKEVGACV